MSTMLSDSGVTYNDSTVVDFTTTAGATSLKVGGVTKATIGTTGVIETIAGVKFPATQVASSDVNTLDDYKEGTWTPTWSTTETAPSLGNGTIKGKYIKIGKMVTAVLKLTLGTTSSVGIGNPSFSLPYAPDIASNTNAITGSCTYFQSGNNWFSAGITGDILAGSISPVHATLGAFTGVVPFAWTSGSSISITVTYIASA